MCSMKNPLPSADLHRTLYSLPEADSYPENSGRAVASHLFASLVGDVSMRKSVVTEDLRAPGTYQI